jgi:putative DNA primase/helicase
VRLAVTQETDEGRRLAPATVKRLTGGDKIRARRMRQDFFEFTPSHTAVMVTNHKPRVSGDDPALWRRIRIVPFDVVVAEPDSGLPDRLALELPAVLAWAVGGYRAYTERGLDAPETVAKWTEDYRVDSDAVGRFLDESTIESPAAHVRARELCTAWSAWSQGNGEVSGSEVEFSAALARRGFEKTRRSVGMVYLGLGLAAITDGTVS